MKRPRAMERKVIAPFVNLTMPFRILLSKRSVKEFIKGTPGTKNNTEVAKAAWGWLPKLYDTPNEAMKEAEKEARKVAILPLILWLWAVCSIYRPNNVLMKATNIFR